MSKPATGLPLFVYTVEVSPVEAYRLTGAGACHLVGTYTTDTGEDRSVLQTTDFDIIEDFLDLDDALAQEAFQEDYFAQRHSWYRPRPLA